MRFVIPATMMIFANLVAHAAPSPSCAGRFVGNWEHKLGATTTNNAEITAGGSVICSGNSGCTQGTWSCTGNVLHYNNGFYDTDYTLVNENLMTARGGITVVRIGKAPAASAGQEPANKCSVIPGNVVRVGCSNDWSGEKKLCECTPLTNNCPDAVARVEYFVSNAKRSRTVTLKPNETKEEEACTSQENTSMRLGKVTFSKK